MVWIAVGLAMSNPSYLPTSLLPYIVSNVHTRSTDCSVRSDPQLFSKMQSRRAKAAEATHTRHEHDCTRTHQLKGKTPSSPEFSNTSCARKQASSPKRLEGEQCRRSPKQVVSDGTGASWEVTIKTPAHQAECPSLTLTLSSPLLFQFKFLVCYEGKKGKWESDRRGVANETSRPERRGTTFNVADLSTGALFPPSPGGFDVCTEVREDLGTRGEGFGPWGPVNH